MNEEIKLTKNEKKVLLEIANNVKKTDSQIAKKIGVSVSSVSRIKDKLTEKGIIKGYMPRIDYSKIGINCYVMVLYSTTPEWWKRVGDEGLKKIVENAPQIVTCIRTNERLLSYIVIYAFTDNTSANKYLNEIQTTYNNYLNIEKIIFLSKENFVKNDPTTLLKIFEKNDIKPDTQLFNKMVKE